MNVSARGNRVMIEAIPIAAARARDVLVGPLQPARPGPGRRRRRGRSRDRHANQPALDGIIAEAAQPPTVMIRTRKKTIVPRSTQTRYMEAWLATT